MCSFTQKAKIVIQALLTLIGPAGAGLPGVTPERVPAPPPRLGPPPGHGIPYRDPGRGPGPGPELYITTTIPPTTNSPQGIY